MTDYKSIRGSQLGFDKYGALAAIAGIFGQKRITPRVAHAAITVGAEAADARAISIQLYDFKGKAIDFAAYFEIVMFSSSAMTDVMSGGGSTGLAAGASGKLQAVVAKLLFRAISTTAGLWTGTYTDTGTAAGYIAVRLPNGEIIGGATITNA